MDSMVKFQRKEIVRLKEENVALRNVCLKYYEKSKQDRKTISILRMVISQVTDRLKVSTGSYDLIRDIMKG